MLEIILALLIGLPVLIAFMIIMISELKREI